MEHLDSNVYELGLNDYWAYIDFNGKRIIYGFSYNWKALFDSVKAYAVQHTPFNTLVEVGVIRRSFLGHTQPLVVKEQVKHLLPR